MNDFKFFLFGNTTTDTFDNIPKRGALVEFHEAVVLDVSGNRPDLASRSVIVAH